MNKKIISIISAAALTLGLVVGGVVVSSMQTSASGTQITLNVESPEVEKDEEITVYVNVSSGEAMSYIQAKVSYDATKLELVGTSSDQAAGTSGEIFIYETRAYGEYERTYELTFKGLEVGSAEVNVQEGNIELYESLELVNVNSSTLPIEVVMNETAADDARIKTLDVAGVSDIKDVFDPDVFEYDLEVGLSMEMFIYSATAMNADSVIVAPEDLMLDIGENHFEVRVTAPAGNEQIYVFNITRLDHEIETETESETELETEVEETELESETVLETESIEALETEVDETELVPVQMPIEEETFTEEPLEAKAEPVVE